MHIDGSRSSFVLARRLSAIALVTCASFTAHAQQSADAADAVSTAPPTQLVADNSSQPTAVPVLDLSSHADLAYSSSVSSSGYADPALAETLNLSSDASATQPPPRRRYGRPRYNDSSHNPDGSNKFGFVLGGGLTLPNGDTYRYLNTNYAVQVGGGRNFSKKASVFAQFDYDRFGFNGKTLGGQQNLYNASCGTTCVSGLDGSSHVWSFSVDPSYNFIQTDTHGVYIVGGAGFYHKTANFTVPSTGTYCDPYYGCYQYAANATIDKYTSNAPGFNGGFGLTYKFSRFANERFFVEARYVVVLNSQRHGITPTSTSSAILAYSGNDFYPANSNRTTWVPVKAGIRF